MIDLQKCLFDFTDPFLDAHSHIMSFEKNPNEENVLDLIEQFFEHYQFRDTLAFFKSESRLFQTVPEQDWRPLNDFRRKMDIIRMLNAGDKNGVFQALEEILPETVLNTRDYQRLEFELNLYLTTTAWEEVSSQEQAENLQEFRRYLETKGTLLSQSTDLLPYYALPYASNPKEHPVYQQLFKEPWRKSVVFRLSTLIDSILSPNLIGPPRLVKVLTEHTTKRDKLMRQLSTLISVSADLLDALENSLKGIKLEDGLMQRIYSRLVNNQAKVPKHGSALTNRSTTSLRDSLRSKNQLDMSTNGSTMLTAAWNEKNEMPLFDLDFVKIKKDMLHIDDRKKCYLLQALRWHHRVREYMARFLNALSSLCRGRAYLGQNSTVVKLLIAELIREKDESVTRENMVGALQKMSLR
ncbi:unnamed protein product [Echinostoma caproni]|uniref:ARMC9 CTLH-like domain-containing protein n=1 Tax=Echinostoma caproni TaxID=27848 RepID=A0A3P8GGM6_9TREM|nr:unnamed protein product [Echinostoma caproni]